MTGALVGMVRRGGQKGAFVFCNEVQKVAEVSKIHHNLNQRQQYALDEANEQSSGGSMRERVNQIVEVVVNIIIDQLSFISLMRPH